MKLYNLEIGARSVAAALSAFGARPRHACVDVYLCVADHYEPQVGHVSQVHARSRHEDWLRRYPIIAARHKDADGCHPAHTFFYPWDEFDAWEFDRLCGLCAEGWGEIELHLHHHDDSSTTLHHKLRAAIATYRSGGALSEWPDGKPAFGFIHGNWALDNSRHEDGHNFCGVDNELDILVAEGCYADFTFPAWQHHAQPRKLNAVYYAQDDPDRPKSYDWGRSARVGATPDPDELLLVQGPLVPCLHPAHGMRRLAMDDGDLAASRRYAPARLDRWVRAGVHVRGNRNRVFVKLHCHGAADQNREILLGEDLDCLFSDAEARYNDGHNYRLHYVTAREMFNVIRATEIETTPTRQGLLPPPGHRVAFRNGRMSNSPCD